MTATYTVNREGYQATMILANGEEMKTGLFPACDKQLLIRSLEAHLNKGEIKSYQVDWVKVQAVAGK